MIVIWSRFRDLHFLPWGSLWSPEDPESLLEVADSLLQDCILPHHFRDHGLLQKHLGTKVAKMNGVLPFLGHQHTQGLLDLIDSHCNGLHVCRRLESFVDSVLKVVTDVGRLHVQHVVHWTAWQAFIFNFGSLCGIGHNIGSAKLSHHGWMMQKQCCCACLQQRAELATSAEIFDCDLVQLSNKSVHPGVIPKAK